MIDLAISEQVDLVVIAGDLYDGDWNEFSTGLHFVNEAARLLREKIPLVVIRGNHDAQSVMTQSLPLPPNPDGSAIILDHHAVDQRIFEKLGIAIHGRSFPKKAVTEDLSLGYPLPIRSMFNLGLLHTSLTGAEGHDNYSPCKPEQLQDKGYDYWALGHIHDRRECHQAGQTPIVFSGNIQGRNIREVGPKGCVVLSIDDDQKSQSTFHPLDVVRWQIFDHDITNDQRRDDMLEAFSDWLPDELNNAEGRPLAIRVNLSGASLLSHDYYLHANTIANELRSLAVQRGGGQAWFENLKVRTTNQKRVADVREHESGSGDSPLASVSLVIEALQRDSTEREQWLQPLRKLWSKLPPELTQNELDPFRLEDEALLSNWLASAEPILMNLIHSESVK